MADGGVFRGSRVEGADYFDDVMGDNEVPDIFRGGGMESFEKIRSYPTAAGMVLEMHCRPPGCGKQEQVTVSWPELFIISHAPQTGILPTGWRRSEVNQGAVPELPCPRCGTPIAPVVTPTWAKSQLENALQRGLTSPQMIAADPQVAQLQARLGVG